MSQVNPVPHALRRLSFSTWSLLALGMGLVLGIVGHRSGLPLFAQLAKVVEPVGALWLAALQMTLIPLLASQLLSAIVGSRSEPGEFVGRLGLRAIALFLTMLAVAGIATVFLTAPIVSFYRIEKAMVHSVTGTERPDSVPAVQTTSSDWTKRLPTNLIDSARKGEILPILIFAALLGAAITRLGDEHREPLTQLLRGFAEAMMFVVRWILVATPAGVFSLSYAAALRAGGAAAGIMGAFILLVCALLLFFTALLYPVTAIAGRTSMREFARAAAPAQLVAISTMSSIAALPALIQGGKDHRLPPRITGFVLPLSVAIFKINRPVSATAKLVFLAHVYGVPLGAGTIAVFIATVILMSFATVGVPSGGQAFSNLPAYLAAGIPVEGVVLLEATAIAPDMLKTLLNVTGDMSAAMLLSRGSRAAAPASAGDVTISELAPEGTS